MNRDILFYQANFEPEINRTIDAFQKGEEKYFNFFRNKTLKIVDEILRFSKKSVEKEEWFAIKNIIQDLEFANTEELEILRKYGNCFSVKFANRFLI
jgi:hypothetical protein